jgi:hypothetical protein
MGQVIISNRVRVKLKNLVDILYKKEYFGFRDSAKKYVSEIEDTIYSIPDLKHSKTKNPKVGMYFVRHKPNSKTTYYICFNTKDDRYLVKTIITNHEKDYKKIMGIA